MPVCMQQCKRCSVVSKHACLTFWWTNEWIGPQASLPALSTRHAFHEARPWCGLGVAVAELFIRWVAKLEGGRGNGLNRKRLNDVKDNHFKTKLHVTKRGAQTTIPWYLFRSSMCEFQTRLNLFWWTHIANVLNSKQFKQIGPGPIDPGEGGYAETKGLFLFPGLPRYDLDLLHLAWRGDRWLLLPCTTLTLPCPYAPKNPSDCNCDKCKYNVKPCSTDTN